MRIPSDIPVNLHAARSSALDALGLKTGQSFSAEVLGQNANGATQLRVGGQQIFLNLPIKPQIGQILLFQLGGTTAKPELTLVQDGARPLSAPTTTTAQAVNSAPAANQTQPAPSAQTISPTPATASGSATIVTTSAASPPPPATQTAVNIPITANTATSLQLQPGQVVTAQVVQPTSGGQAQISIGNQQIQVPAPLPGAPPPGTSIQLRADFSGATPRLVAATPTPATSSGSTIQGSAQTLQASSPTATANTPVTPASVQQAISQTIATSVTTQNSLSALLASVTGLSTSATQLPTGVNAVIDQILGARINLDTDPPTAELLRDAIGRAGVFLEANLARGQSLPQVQADVKALLLLLKNALGNWLGEVDPQQHLHGKKPPPPSQGNTPRAQIPDPPPLPNPANAREAGRQLHAQTDAALSRLKLFQLASLPEGGARGNPAAAQEWNFELPFTLGNQTSMAQFQISRDAEGQSEDGTRGWQMVFAMNFKIIGEVGAKVSLRSRRTGVMLWAENEETAEVLSETLPELTTSLEALGLEVGAMHVRQGAPEQKPPPVGGFVDSVT